MDLYEVDQGHGVSLTVQLSPEDAKAYGKRAKKVSAPRTPGAETGPANPPDKPNDEPEK